MRYALDVAPFGDLSDPLTLVRLAEARRGRRLGRLQHLGHARARAWTRVAADPFVALAGVAAATERLALLASVIVLPRRRPQLVAQAAATLDRLSGGRLVLGVGAGGDRPDYEAFGEDWTSAVRVARMDEAVEIVDAFLRGETVTQRRAGLSRSTASGSARDRRSSRGRRSGWARSVRAASGGRRGGTAGSR